MTDIIDPFEPEEKEKIKAAVIRGSDLVPDESSSSPPPAETVHPMVSIEQLERGSPSPFKGKPDPEFSELDSRDPLYMPRFLVRRWGAEKFLRSSYYALWKSEASRAEQLSPPPDLKPSAQKKKR